MRGNESLIITSIEIVISFIIKGRVVSTFNLFGYLIISASLRSFYLLMRRRNVHGGHDKKDELMYTDEYARAHTHTRARRPHDNAGD